MQNHRLITTLAARLDLDDAVAWYESKQEGLGIEFLLEFYDTATLVQTNPRMNRIVHGEFCRFLLDRFPYKAYYRIDDRTSDWRMVIVAIFHTSTGNRKIASRLGEPDE